MSADPQSPSQPLPGTVFNARQARLLKVAVVVMGLILVLGIVVLLSAIVYQATRLDERPSAVGGSEAALELGLPAEATVSHMALDGNRLAVLVSDADGAQVLVLDVATGDIVARIRLHPE